MASETRVLWQVGWSIAVEPRKIRRETPGRYELDRNDQVNKSQMSARGYYETYEEAVAFIRERAAERIQVAKNDLQRAESAYGKALALPDTAPGDPGAGESRR